MARCPPKPGSKLYGFAIRHWHDVKHVRASGRPRGHLTRVASRVSLGNLDTRELALREIVNNLTLLRIYEARVNIEQAFIGQSIIKPRGLSATCSLAMFSV